MIDINAGVLKAALGSFADDTRVWHAISAGLEAGQLQDDLNRIFHWTTANNMMLNDRKSEHMGLGSLEPQVSYTTPELKQRVLSRTWDSSLRRICFSTNTSPQQQQRACACVDGLCELSSPGARLP